MDDIGKSMIVLGALLLLGFTTHFLGRRTRLPRVTLLLALGMIIGPTGLDVLPDEGSTWFDLLATMAFAIVGFLLGEHFTIATLRLHGKPVLFISVCVVAVTAIVVFLGLRILGVPIELALLLAGIATATDPAATVDVIQESEAEGDFTQTLRGIVAVDDAWGLLLFSVLLAIVDLFSGSGTGVGAVLHGSWEIAGAVLIGVLLGVPMAFLTGRIRPGQVTMVEALGCVFLCAGLAVAAGVSYLIACMVLGVAVSNLARHHERPFHAIEDIKDPFLILFFLLAGSSLDLNALPAIGWIGLGYMILRVAGRVIGNWMGARLSGADPAVRRWIGLALLPQAGVAIGMALVVVDRFPDSRQLVLPLVLGATVVFELVGPLVTRKAIASAHEIRKS